MEKIQLFPQTQGQRFAYRFKALIYLIILVGTFNLFAGIFFDSDSIFSGNIASGAINIILGFLLLYVANSMNSNKDCFIEWDERAVRYLFPGMARPEEIPYSSMKEIVVGLTEIGIALNSGRERHLKLDSLEYGKLKRIKERFEEIKLRVEGMNVD